MPALMRRFGLLSLLMLVLAACGGNVPGASSRGQPLALLVPLYAWPQPGNPADPFRRVASAAAQVPVTVILNPNNGPIAPPPPEFLQTVQALHAAGVQALGYVATGFGARAPAAIVQDIYTWQGYGVDGIFLDEVATNMAAHYTSLCRTARGMFPVAVLNPGAPVSAAYLDARNGCTAAVMFEDTETRWQTASPATPTLPPARLAALVHSSLADPAAMQRDLNLAVQRGFGMVFVTDGRLPNPWGALPGYWDQEVSVARALRVR